MVRVRCERIGRCKLGYRCHAWLDRHPQERFLELRSKSVVVLLQELSAEVDDVSSKVPHDEVVILQMEWRRWGGLWEQQSAVRRLLVLVSWMQAQSKPCLVRAASSVAAPTSLPR